MASFPGGSTLPLGNLVLLPELSRCRGNTVQKELFQRNQREGQPVSKPGPPWGQEMEVGREGWAVDWLLTLVHFSLTWPYQEPPHPSFSLVSNCAPLTRACEGRNRHSRAMLLKKGASKNLGLSFGGVTEPPQGSPFLCIVARRSCPLGCAPPAAAVSPASWAWSDWPTVRICTGPRASHLSSASAAGPPVPAGHGHS